MTVTQYYMDDPTPKRYLGLAADDKPTAGVATGSRFYETDIGKEFIFSGSA